MQNNATIESGTMKYDDATKVEANNTTYPAINTGTRDILARYDERARADTVTRSHIHIAITPMLSASSVASDRSIIIPMIPTHWRYSILSDSVSLV